MQLLVLLRLVPPLLSLELFSLLVVPLSLLRFSRLPLLLTAALALTMLQLVSLLLQLLETLLLLRLTLLLLRLRLLQLTELL